jgi:hypothetical protein
MIKINKEEMIIAKIKELKDNNWGVGYMIRETIEQVAERAVNNKLKEIEEQEQREMLGIIKMSYSEYKNKYAGYKTVENSYDKKMKTIEVITKPQLHVNNNKPCVKCGTYCYGDCCS